MKSYIYTATAPSNIAFLKYWGKEDEAEQWPANDSLSMTLDKLCSVTQAQLISAPDHVVHLDDEPIGREHRKGHKIFRHLDFLSEHFSQKSKLSINSRNSFPTGCGIASSASGMAALTIAALAAWFDIENLDAFAESSISPETLANLSRLGSGSAGRSLFEGIVHWRKGTSPQTQEILTVFSRQHWALMDTVVIFSSQEKTVGSTDAHRAAWTSPLFKPRLAGLPNRCAQMMEAIAEKDMSRLGPLLEVETLEMHGVIMSARPAVHYFGEQTSNFLAWIRDRREAINLPVYFTLDAGANVHLIHEQKNHAELMSLLKQYPNIGETLSDHIGGGAFLSKSESRVVS